MIGDAGFRRYYRFTYAKKSFIAVDAPPSKSNNQAFVLMQKYLLAKGLIVPDIIDCNLDLGFMCLSDFGDRLLYDELSADNMTGYYRQAIDLLPEIASVSPSDAQPLPCYDRAFIELELSIFSEWLLEKHLNITLSAQEENSLQQCFTVLIDSALDQPQVTMHRDYHSRNLMLLADNRLGIIDFQDAVVGPISYDVVSLLRDCYLRWPEENVQSLLRYFCQLMAERFSLTGISLAQWQQWFDLMGLQRHLKASGIFARLFYRDGKDAYLASIPLTLSYIVDISGKYPELQFLSTLLNEKVLPAMEVNV